MTAPAPRERYLDWASLLKRVFQADVLACPDCGSPRKIIAFIEEPKVARKILECLGLSSTGPPRAPSRAARQQELFS